MVKNDLKDRECMFILILRSVHAVYLVMYTDSLILSSSIRF